jgi:hypothetical protein
MNISAQHSKAEIGFVLSRPYWNKGLMSEALTSVLEYSFEHIRLNRIEGSCLVDNRAGIAVLEKVGMKREGLLTAGWVPRRKEAFPDTARREDYVHFCFGGICDALRLDAGSCRGRRGDAAWMWARGGYSAGERRAGLGGDPRLGKRLGGEAWVGFDRTVASHWRAEGPLPMLSRPCRTNTRLAIPYPAV